MSPNNDDNNNPQLDQPLSTNTSTNTGDQDSSAPAPTDLPDLTSPDTLLALLDDPAASLREQAFTLYCHGFRSTAIAATLGIPSRTIRRWLADMRTLIAAEAHAGRTAELLRAIESHRAIAGSAWEAYEHERQLERQILSGELDHIRRRVRRRGGRPRTQPPAPPSPATDANNAHDTPSTEDTLLEEIERPALPRQGARFLAVALAAQREVARLQGLYDHLQPERPPIHFLISAELPGEDGQPTTVIYGQTPSDTVSDAVSDAAENSE